MGVSVSTSGAETEPPRDSCTDTAVGVTVTTSGWASPSTSPAVADTTVVDGEGSIEGFVWVAGAEVPLHAAVRTASGIRARSTSTTLPSRRSGRGQARRDQVPDRVGQRLLAA